MIKIMNTEFFNVIKLPIILTTNCDLFHTFQLVHVVFVVLLLIRGASSDFASEV